VSVALLEALISRESRDGVTFSVKVAPRAKLDEIVGVEGGVLKVRVNAPPVEGKANAALVKLLAKALSVKRSQIEIVRGEKTRLKTIMVHAADAGKISNLLAPRGTGNL
jgi:uncharacterized protein